MYIAVHLAALVISVLAVLFTMGDFGRQSLPLYTLWQQWNRLDTTHFDYIASYGYIDAWRTAFFPLYPLLIHGLTLLVHKTFFASLLIANVADFVLLAVLYRLVAADFDEQCAQRSVLYLSFFPTGFFLIAGYNESLFLCFVLLSFYFMRQGQWWPAGVFGFLACLTRSAGIFLLLPFCYEYLQQHQFHLKKLRFDVLAGALLPLATGIFALYCFLRFGDILAFSHAQAHWDRELHAPWYGMVSSVRTILHSSGLLGFYPLRNLTDLLPALFILALIILGFIGPWRFSRSQWAYGIYAGTLYLFIHLVPVAARTDIPLQSVGRLMIEIFPAFIVLAAAGRHRMVHVNYLAVAGALFFFLLAQFLTNRWVP